MTTQNQSTAQPSKSQTIALFSRTERDPATVTTSLKRAKEEFHLVSPAPACGAIPEGFAVAFSAVTVDPQVDTYETKNGGKRGLHRHVLDRIANAAAMSWDPIASHRLDDGADPHYCAFQAAGRYKHFDGSEVVCMGTKEMDLREGSPQIAGKSDKEISMQRVHILAHAETKARLRAIAAMGIKRAYTIDELRKPFVVARLMFTGQTEDPALRREFALMRARKALGVGEPHFASFPQLPGQTMAPALLAAPQVGTVHDDDDAPPADDQPGSSAPAGTGAP